MRTISISIAAALAVAGLCAPAQADIVSMAGDADCFGLGGTCAPGDLWASDLGGTFFTDYSTPEDPDFTDSWESFGPVNFDLAGGAGSGFSVDLFVAGIADGPDRGPYAVFFNGTQIGQIEETGIDPDNAYQQVVLFSFAVPDALVLVDNVLSFEASDAGDGYIIDYAALLSSSVPEPASWAMMLGGMAAIGGLMRRRRTSVAFA